MRSIPDCLLLTAVFRPSPNALGSLAGLTRRHTAVMRDHKSLVAWQRAHGVVLTVLRICRTYWQPHAAAVFSQLQRSALSVQLNIAEGHALKTPRRFKNHLTIAYGSVVETIELLELALEANLVPQTVGQPALSASIETRRLLLGLIKKYGKDNKTGSE